MMVEPYQKLFLFYIILPDTLVFLLRNALFSPSVVGHEQRIGSFKR